MISLLGSSSPLTTVGLATGASGLFTLVVGPLVEWGARRAGWMDHPSAKRWHEGTIPNLGGIAIGIGIAAGVTIGGDPAVLPGRVWGGAVLLFAAGLVDDLWGLRPAPKLGAQLGAAALLLSTGLLFWPAGPVWVSGLLTVLWALGLTNALNLLDAMDGIAAGVAGIAALSFSAIALLQGRIPLLIIATAIAAASAGFLVYNFPPARLFMGDCGSLPLGYLLAAVGLEVQWPPAAGLPALLPVVVLAVPLFDTLFVSITRMRRGQSIAEGGVDHTMHRLTRLGWSERPIALLFYGLGLLCGGIGLTGQVAPPILFYALGIGLAGGASVIGWLLARHTGPEVEATPSRDPHAEEPALGQTDIDREVPSSEGPRS